MRIHLSSLAATACFRFFSVLLIFAAAFPVSAQQRVLLNPNFVQRFDRATGQRLPDFTNSPALPGSYPTPTGVHIRYLGDARCLTPSNTPVDTQGCVVGWKTTDPHDDLREAVQDGYLKAPIQVGFGPTLPNGGAELNAENPARVYQTLCLVAGEKISFEYALGHPGAAPPGYSQTRAGIFLQNNNYPGNPAGADSVALSTSVAVQLPRVPQAAEITVPTSGSFQVGLEVVQPDFGQAGNVISDLKISLKPLVDFAPSFVRIGEQRSGLLTLRINGTAPAAFTVAMKVVPGTASAADFTIAPLAAVSGPGATGVRVEDHGTNAYLVTIPQGTYDGQGPNSLVPLFEVSALLDGLFEEPESLQVIIEEPGVNDSSDASTWDLASKAPCIAGGSTSVTATIIDHRAEWIAAAPLQQSRQAHAAVYLPEGRVLVVGGAGLGDAPLDSAELFDPATGKWTATGALAEARQEPTATLLRSGKVLVAGGGVGQLFGAGIPRELATAELYDPAHGTFSPAGSFAGARRGHTATLLPNGEVLIAGGFAGDENRIFTFPRANAIYAPESIDPPESGGFPTTPPACGSAMADDCLIQGRAYHTATLLPSGKVLVIGGAIGVSFDGQNYTALTSAELYDPASDEWSAAAPMTNPRVHHTATLLPNGKVLVVGFHQISDDSTAELYDPATDVWLPAGSAAGISNFHNATLLVSGQVLFTGLDGQSRLYQPDAGNGEGTWIDGADLEIGRTFHTATLLPSGAVLMAGGLRDDVTTADVQLYLPLSVWNPTLHIIPPKDYPERLSHTATLLPYSNGKVLIAGGENAAGRLDSCDLFDPGTETFSATAPLPEPRSQHTATLLPNGKVLIAGGLDRDGQPLGSILIYDPATGQWSNTGRTIIPRRLHSATLIASTPTAQEPMPGGKVLFVGGLGAGPFATVKTTQIYDLDNDQVAAAGDLTEARAEHTATLLPSGKVLVAGGQDALGFTFPSVELYDPDPDTEPEDKWTSSNQTELDLCGPTAAAHPDRPCPLSRLRARHTATRLPGGGVLVAAGELRIGPLSFLLAASEVYDPDTGRWTSVGSLNQERMGHRATLLRSGNVLVTGGSDDSTQTPEIYDPVSRSFHPLEPWATRAQRRHSATLLPSGKVLLAGGELFGTPVTDFEIYDATPNEWMRQPILQRPNPEPLLVKYGESFTLSGWNLGGKSEGSSGDPQQSASNYPSLQIRGAEGEATGWLSLGTLPNLCTDGSAFCFGGSIPPALTVKDLPSELSPGLHLVTAFVGGIASESRWLELACSLGGLQHPVSVEELAIGTTATFAVKAAGGRLFQWQQCDGDSEASPSAGTCAADSEWHDIPGATGASYTTPPVTGPESGRRFRVIVASDCMKETSDFAELTVADSVAPTGDVVTPNGGEFWILSEPAVLRSELITWDMADDVRICQVRVILRGSPDGEESHFQQLASGLVGRGVDTYCIENGAIAACPPQSPPVIAPMRCSPPGEGIRNIKLVMPDDFSELGGSGWQYRIFVEVTDHAGHTAPFKGDNNFFIVRPNDDSVKALIVWNSARLETLTTKPIADLDRTLGIFANHPLVQGRVIDLDKRVSLDPLYAAWDGDPGDVEKANSVLFAPGGIQEYLHDLLTIFTGVQHLVLIGDDRIIPFARLEDRGEVLSEESYPDGHSLSPGGSTVGRALAQNQYLSDDPLATRDPVVLDDDGSLIPAAGAACPESPQDIAFIPDLAVGRLVELPADISKTLTTFISQGGILDLGAADSPENKVLVTGYDFLLDSAAEIAGAWRHGLDAPTGPAVDSSLAEDPQDWGTENLLAALCGPEDVPYPVASLSGHANHFAEGVPGDEVHFDQGLFANLLIAPDACGGHPLDLAGGVYYAIGCHGGLPVPGSDIDDADHSLDLPEIFLGLGLLGYVANTGYGWGLLEGPPGYGEKMVDLFTEELIAASGAVTLGETISRTKTRYLLEDSGCFDAYDQKSLMQWTLFGLPMYAVKLREAEPARPERPAPRRLDEVPPVETFGGVVVRRAEMESLAALPPFLTRLDLRFDFSADGVYKKFQATPADDGPSTRIPLEIGDPCPAEASGCYYTLNGLATGQADLPVQPYFVYSSRLAGTSQHGVLWKGGTFAEETGWKALRGALQSNNEGGPGNLGALPQVVLPRIRPTRFLPGEDPGEADGCRPTDLELNQLVVPTGALVTGAAGEPTRERRDLTMELEVFYLDDDSPGSQANCDRQGPIFGEGPFHHVDGTVVEWDIDFDDPEKIWRVVVVHEAWSDTPGRGAWVPVELEQGTDRRWRGSYEAEGHLVDLHYFLQAVDRHGNVSWRLFDGSGDEAASGIPADLPEPGLVHFEVGEIDLALAMTDSSDPLPPGGQLGYGIAVTHRGVGSSADTASRVQVTDKLPAGVTFLGELSDGWTCRPPNAGEVVCDGPNLEPGETSDLLLAVRAPAHPTYLWNTARVRARETDLNDADDTDGELTLIGTGAFPPGPPTIAPSSPAGEAVVPCGVLRRPLSSLRLALSEALRDPPGDDLPEDVSYRDNYLLLAPGPNGVYDSGGCAAGLAGDDARVPIAGLEYRAAAPGPEVLLQLGDGRPLDPGLYRLMVCASLRDLDDQPLDGNGDGVGGDDFSSDFRLDPFNLVPNGHFDACGGPTLEPWQSEATPPDEIAAVADADAGSSALSGAALLRSGGASLAIRQCLELGATRWLLQRARVRVTEAGAGEEDLPPFVASCAFHDGPACGGPVAGSAQAAFVPNPAGSPEWRLFEHNAPIPAGARSADCAFGFAAVPLPFAGQLDQLFVSGETLLFADGFEAGDLAAWSAAFP